MKKIYENIAEELNSKSYFIEKDFHICKILQAISLIREPGFQIMFGGGTGLSKAWKIIPRFSEDIDFKIQIPEGTGKSARSDIRQTIFAAVEAAGYKDPKDPICARSQPICSRASQLPERLRRTR